MTKVKPKFLRRKPTAYSKLGNRRKKKQVWRKPTGRDNKMREKLKGRPAVVSIGYRTDKIARGMIEEKQPVYVENVSQLKRLRENEVPILGSVGIKKKIEIAKFAEKSNIKIHNLNVKKFLKQRTRSPISSAKNAERKEVELKKKTEKKTETKTKKENKK